MSQTDSTSSETAAPDSVSSGSSPAVEEFIARWKGKDGGERSNYQLFIAELCDSRSPAPVSFFLRQC